jgi:broad specificity phosphatase PhoE
VQAFEAGKKLKEMIGNDSVRFWVSPYKRTKMTLEEILRSFDQRVSVREEPRIREQDWGNFQNPELIQQLQKHRKKFGIFYFRFPEGESGADVYDRVSS